MADTLQKIFSGTEVEVLMLKGELEENGILCMTRDDQASSIGVGYYSGTTSTIELYINSNDFSAAEPILADFLKHD